MHRAVAVLLAALGAMFALSGSAAAQFVASMSELYRFRDATTGQHLYTIDRRDPALAGGSFTLEGVAAYVFGLQELMSVPLHRFVHRDGGDRLYTLEAKPTEARDGDYVHEGICCYAFAEPIFATVPLYGFVETATGRHLYTTSPAELRDDAGFRSQGVVAHVYPATAPLPLRPHVPGAR